MIEKEIKYTVELIQEWSGRRYKSDVDFRRYTLTLIDIFSNTNIADSIQTHRFKENGLHYTPPAVISLIPLLGEAERLGIDEEYHYGAIHLPFFEVQLRNGDFERSMTAVGDITEHSGTAFMMTHSEQKHRIDR